MPSSKKGLKRKPYTNGKTFHSTRRINGNDLSGVRFSGYPSKMESVGCAETSLNNY